MNNDSNHNIVHAIEMRLALLGHEIFDRESTQVLAIGVDIEMPRPPGVGGVRVRTNSSALLNLEIFY